MTTPISSRYPNPVALRCDNTVGTAVQACVRVSVRVSGEAQMSDGNVRRKRAFNPPWMSDGAHIRHRNALQTVLAESTANDTSDQLRP